MSLLNSKLRFDCGRVLFAATGLGFSRPMLRQLMAALDTDCSGTIDEDEFLKLFAETSAAKASVA